MKILTFITVFLLLTTGLTAISCGAPKLGSTPATVEEAEAILAKQAKEKAKIAKKERKKAYKRFWKMQTKEAKKSIKKNNRRQKKIEKARRKSEY